MKSVSWLEYKGRYVLCWAVRNNHKEEPFWKAMVSFPTYEQALERLEKLKRMSNMRANWRIVMVPDSVHFEDNPKKEFKKFSLKWLVREFVFWCVMSK